MNSSTIVQRVWNYCNVLRDERRLESARAVESAVEAALVRAGRVRQAILREAFSGRLPVGAQRFPCKAERRNRPAVPQQDNI